MERKVIGAFACLLVLVAVPAMAQDDCATAITITQNGGGVAIGDPCNDTTPTGGLGMGVYCDPGATLDYWAKFQATSDTARIRTDLGSAGTDSTYLVWLVGQADVCDQAGWTPYWCSGDEGGASGYLGDITVDGLTAGEWVLIQIGVWQDVACGDYTMTIEDPPPVPTLPQAGLLALSVLLLGGGAVVFGRLRAA